MLLREIDSKPLYFVKWEFFSTQTSSGTSYRFSRRCKKVTRELKGILHTNRLLLFLLNTIFGKRIIPSCALLFPFAHVHRQSREKDESSKVEDGYYLCNIKHCHAKKSQAYKSVSADNRKQWPPSHNKCTIQDFIVTFPAQFPRLTLANLSMLEKLVIYLS